MLEAQCLEGAAVYPSSEFLQSFIVCVAITVCDTENLTFSVEFFDRAARRPSTDGRSRTDRPRRPYKRMTEIVVRSMYIRNAEIQIVTHRSVLKEDKASVVLLTNERRYSFAYLDG